LPDSDAVLLTQARHVASRLERLSPDSTWQRRASGTRGALLRLLEQASQGSLAESEIGRLKNLVATGYKYLESAAQML